MLILGGGLLLHPVVRHTVVTLSESVLNADVHVLVVLSPQSIEVLLGYAQPLAWLLARAIVKRTRLLVLLEHRCL
jgi:hypothetical protein